MQAKGRVCLVVVAAVFGSAPAFGQTNNASVSFRCVGEQSSEGGGEKLVTIKGNERELIALCNFLDPYDSENQSAISDLMKEQAVVLDSEYQLRVIDRCSEQTICQADLADSDDCSTASKETENSFTENGVCVIEPDSLVNVQQEGTVLSFNGSLRCKDVFSEKSHGEETDFGFMTGCVGYLAISFNQFEETLPCTVNINTGSEFQVPKSCQD